MMRRVRWIGILAACLVGAAACATSTPTPVADARPANPTVDFFYEELSPHGGWMWLEGPGWVWYPYNVEVDWLPYSRGRWVHTESGWTWVSDEDWGWAVYHYGRWHFEPRYGWVWVPGALWGPAWVAWHWGDGWAGWAPLPWRVKWRAGIGLDWGGVDLYAVLDPTWWCFVEPRYLVEPGLHRRLAPPARNVTLLKITKNVTKYAVVQNRIVNQGVNVEIVRKATGRPVPRLRIAGADSPHAAGVGKIKGTELVLFRPDPSKGRPAHAQADPGRGGAPDTPGRGPAVRSAPGSAPGSGAPRQPTWDARRRDRDFERLKSQHTRESDELERIHGQETGKPGTGESQELINRRQDEEHKALRTKQERERQLFEERARRGESAGRPGGSAPAAERPASQGSGRESSAAPQAGKPKQESAKPKADKSQAGKAKPEKPKPDKPKPGGPDGSGE